MKTPRFKINTMRKIVSCPANLERYKIIKNQAIESLVEEVVEYSVDDGNPYFKLLSIFCLSLLKGISLNFNYTMVESKLKEIIIKMFIQYSIHEMFYIVKTISY